MDPYEKLGLAIIQQACDDFEDAMIVMHSAVAHGAPKELLSALRTAQVNAQSEARAIKTYYKDQRPAKEDESPEEKIKRLEAVGAKRDELLKQLKANALRKEKALAKAITRLGRIGEALIMWDDVMRFVSEKTCEKYMTNLDAVYLLGELIKIEMAYIRDGITPRQAQKLAKKQTERNYDKDIKQIKGVLRHLGAKIE